MYVDILWVHEDHRKNGIGTKLLLEAEKEAIRRGCHHVHLDTMSWQAPDFYRKHGYEVIGILPDIPAGNQKYLLMKALWRENHRQTVIEGMVSDTTLDKYPHFVLYYTQTIPSEGATYVLPTQPALHLPRPFWRPYAGAEDEASHTSDTGLQVKKKTHFFILQFCKTTEKGTWKSGRLNAP